MRTWLNLLLYFFLMGFIVSAMGLDAPTPEQLEDWFEDDQREHQFDRKRDDGVLVFLQTPPDKRTPHSINILTIEPDSLQSGWVKIDQCHEQLDPVEKVEVVYRYNEMRDLRITRSSGIGRARVEGQSIQLENVEKNASVCVQTEARILYKQDDGGLLLRNGPFQRRFLDSYFPMHVTLTVSYPDEYVSLQDINPADTTGLKMKLKQGLIYIDTWFEGKLMIELEFRPLH